MSSEILEVSAGVDCFTRRHPLGVVAGITPFNFPAMVPMWMFPMAIACGNTFVLKPSEQVPFTPVRLGEWLREAGLPDGVFNVIQGDRQTVEELLDESRVRAVTFVGSTPAARAVYLRGTANGKRVLALGGAKNHLVVVPDADPVSTARSVAASATALHGGQCPDRGGGFRGHSRCHRIRNGSASARGRHRAGDQCAGSGSDCGVH
jgi:malonate-semialdehyde dehydrogenase (acetylating)/methylmalonate-semialdehyde dehydrogenase